MSNVNNENGIVILKEPNNEKKSIIFKQSKTHKIDCSKLQTGMIVKNYKAMCNLLNEQICNGKSKRLQLEHWRCYFDFEKDGQKFIIGEVFDNPLPTFDARKQKDGIYVKYIELLLMEYLSKQKGYMASLTKKDLYILLGMSSLIYHDYNTTYSSIKNVMDNRYEYPASDEDIQIFYQRADRKLNAILMSALKSMANRFLINYSTEYVICEKETYMNDNGKKISHNIYRIADDEEIRKILKAQQETLKELNIEKFSDVFLKNKMKEYFSILDDYVRINYNWEFVYSQIKIIYLADEIERQIPVRADEIRKLSLQGKIEGLNQVVLDSLNIQAQKKYDEEQEKIVIVSDEDLEVWGEKSNMTMNVDENGEVYDTVKIKYNTNFVPIQKQLADYLIKINDAEKHYIMNKFNTDNHMEMNCSFLDEM